MIPEGSAGELLSLIDSERACLRQVLAAADAAALSHSADGKWTVVENLRHLLFVEQGLGRFAPSGVTWSPLGYPPPGLWKHKAFSAFTFDAKPTAEEILAEWDSAHVVIRTALTRDDPDVRRELGKNVRHLRGHIKQIESALRAWKKQVAAR